VTRVKPSAARRKRRREAERTAAKKLKPLELRHFGAHSRTEQEQA
jgi:hypothetical protein